MEPYLPGAVLALWFGLLTSLSPCPLATNLAAISFIGRRAAHPRTVLLAGLMYTLGQMTAYGILAMLVVSSLLSAPIISLNLQRYLVPFLGPALILVGMVLLGLLTFGGVGVSPGSALQQRLARGGAWGAALLGIVFALSFCPVSAAYFFGSLIPLALQCRSPVIVPSLYGLGTGLPVLTFAVLLTYNAWLAGKVFNGLSAVEWWAQRGTGAVLVLLGIYLTLRSIYRLPI